MELTNEKDSINLNTTYPITDNEGKKLTPYQFTITNTCDLFASYTINLEMLEGTTLSSQYIKTMINSEAITNLSTLESVTPTISGATESRVLFKGSLGAGDSTDYTFRLWMDYDAPLNSDTVSKVFNSKITVTSEVSTYSPVENGFNKLAEALLVNEYQTTSLDVAKNKIASKQSVDTTKTAPIIEWQEYHEATAKVNLAVTRVDPSAVGTYNITDLTAKVLLGKAYNFNSETGYYELIERAYYDPSTLDYSSSDYYICGSNITVTDNNSVTYWDGTSCPIIYKIAELTLTESGTITLSGGDSVATKKYKFKVSKLYEIEIESDKSDKGIYYDTDDYGTTYYYRGNVTNNYVKFANAYWRVIRINGDGSIRLLYNGTNLNVVGKTGIGSYVFNEERNNPTYVGYMYSNTLNASYEDTIKNDNDSNVKIVLDNWYKTNILDTGYSTYIADSGFCNDRSLSVGTGTTSGENTIYSANGRVNKGTPIFTCPNPKVDLFTLAGNVNGNGALTYPIGMITIDELLFSGFCYGYLNKMAYAYSSSSYWTISPAVFNPSSSIAGVWMVGAEGTIGNIRVISPYDVRPVINLKADTEISGGIGTKNDPFIVK